MDNTYCKRQGTSGIRGQLYETKLLSLINFRFLHYDDIETFHLATNVDKIGSFDDICFKIKLKGEKPFFVFIQAKHKENIEELFSYKTDMGKNFKSYLTIRYKFEPKQKDVLFKGIFNETQCIFVIYSNARNELTDLDESSFTNTVNELIGTGGEVKKPFNSAEDVKYLCEIAIKEQFKELAGRMVQYINNEIHFSNIMSDDLILRYHVIMRQKIFDVSVIFDAHDPRERHRMVTFRQEFFDSHEEHIALLKEALYTQILEKRKFTDDDKHNLEEFLKDPLDVTILSKLIVTVISYNNGKLQLVERASSLKDFRQKLGATYVPELTVNKAIELAAKEILETQKMKVPTSFGNKDLTMRSRRRLDFMIKKLSKLLEQSDTNEITIDESLEDKEGFLKLNGGVASAVGNVLVIDKDPKYMKFTDNCDELEGWAKILLQTLKQRFENLQEYKFNFKVRVFPKLTFGCCFQEEDLAKDFLNKLLFFTNQSDEAGVGKQLKKEIEDEQHNHVKRFLVNTDAIYLRYHKEIQTWWMTAKEAPYLTKSSNKFKNVMDDILKDRLMSHVTYMTNINKTKCLNYTFEKDAVKCIKLQLQTHNIFIAENCEMLLAKVIQYLKHLNEKVIKELSSETIKTCEKEIDDKILLPDPKNSCEKQKDDKKLSSDANDTCEEQKDNKKKSQITKLTKLDSEYIVLDFRYILKLLRNEFEALSAELSSMNDKILLIFMCDDIQNTEHVRKSLKAIAKSIGNRKIIVITNEKSVNIIQKYFIQTATVLSDDKHSIIELIAKSQKSMLENAKVIYQGKEMSFDLIVDGETMKYVKGEVLNCIIQQKAIVIGKSIGNNHYDETSYIDGRLRSNADGANVKTLHDIDDDVVVVTGKPGMGKSTLLTHLSLATKKIDPKVWIVRINLLEHSSIFSKWKNDNTNIDTLETLKFMCQAILYEKLGKKHEVQILLEEVDGVIQLQGSYTDEWIVFELKLFLHYYYRKNIIFLFDGFDEIYSYYKDKVLECVQSVRNCPRKHKIWITSRPSNEIESVLREKLGFPHEMEPLSYNERAIYLTKFWKSNLILNQFDSEQLDSVYDFLKYMSELKNRECQRFEFERLLHEIYVSAGLYLANEIKHTHIPLWKYERNIDDSYYIEQITDMVFTELFHKNSSDGTPLLLHLTADYFQNLIQAKTETMKWNLDINTFDIYDKYLEKKLKIRVEEKYDADICMPDFNKYYKEKLAVLILKHKQLGAYAVFSEFSEKLFSKEELKEILNIIKFIEEADEETGHICKVANGIPIFAHMTFTEYYAVEYICDVLKNERCTEKQKSILDFIFSVVLSTVDLSNVQSIFDHKLKTDQTLNNVLLENKDYIFEILLEQGKKHADYITSLQNKYLFTQGDESSRFSQRIQKGPWTGQNYIHQWPLSEDISENLHNVKSLFMTIFESNLNEQNLDVFLDILISSNVLVWARSNVCDEFLIFILDFVRKNHKTKFNSVINHFPHVSCENYEEMTSKELIDEIQEKYGKKIVNFCFDIIQLTADLEYIKAKRLTNTMNDLTLSGSTIKKPVLEEERP